MPSFMNQTSSLSIGEVGAKFLGTSGPQRFFNGFLQADEVLYSGPCITKRPPIKLICSFPAYAPTEEVYNASFFLRFPLMTYEDAFLLRVYVPEDGLSYLYRVVNGSLVSEESLALAMKTYDIGNHTGKEPPLGEGNSIIRMPFSDIDPTAIPSYAHKPELLLEGLQVFDWISGSLEVPPTVGRHTTVNNYIGQKIQYFFNGQLQASHNYLLNDPSGIVEKRGALAETLYYSTGTNSLKNILVFGEAYLPQNWKYKDVIVESDSVTFIGSGYTVFINNDGDVSYKIEEYQAFVSIENATYKFFKAKGYPEFICMLGKTIVYTATSKGTGNVKITPTEKEFVIVVNKTYGSTVFWARHISKGIVMATNAGIFLLSMSDTNESIADIIRITDDMAGDVPPALYNDFIFFVSGNDIDIRYIIFDKFSNNATVGILSSSYSILPKSEKIVKIDKMNYGNSVVLVILTEKHNVVVGVAEALTESGISNMSFSRWFTDYDVYEILSLDRKAKDKLYIRAARKGDVGMFVGQVELEDHPFFRSDGKENRGAHLDLYVDIDMNKVNFPTETLLSGSSATYKANVPFYCFTENGERQLGYSPGEDGKQPYVHDFFRHTQMRIKSDEFIVQLRPKENANQTSFPYPVDVISPKHYPDDFPFTLTNYQWQSQYIWGLPHLSHYMSNGIDVHIYTDSGKEIKMEQICSSQTYKTVNDEYFGKARIGIPYEMKVVLAPFSGNGPIISSKLLCRLFFSVFGWSNAYVSIGSYRKTLHPERRWRDYSIDHALNTRSPDDLDFIKIFFTKPIPQMDVYCPMIYLRTTCAIPPFIGSIGVTCNEEIAAF